MDAAAAFRDLARRGARAPLVTDLYLHAEPDPEAARRDGRRLARVIARAAAHGGLPVASPLMDLRLDKADLLAPLGLDEDAADRFQFAGPIAPDTFARLEAGGAPLHPASAARDEALRVLAAETDLLPIGLVIGPFSLATKLLADPITAAAMLDAGAGPEDEPHVRLLLDAHALAEAAVRRAVRRQLDAGARALIVCEPTASTAFLSPRRIRAGGQAFERLVIEPNLRLKADLDAAGAALFFHDCGELVPEMVRVFGERIHPAVLSLGSSRALWDDAALVPGDVILYGNLPSKSFYSDAAMPVAEVERRTVELIRRMRATGHPFIVGSECDVLHVPEAAEAIRRKVEALRTVEVAD